MKIVSYDSGRLVALLSSEAFTPLPFTGPRGILDIIGQHYKFVRVPNLAQRAEAEDGLTFELGEYQTPKGAATINKLSIFRDGIVVAAPTTEIAEEFFDGLYAWLIAELSFRNVPVKRIYMSELVVDFDKPASALLKNFDAISAIATRDLGRANRPATGSFGGFSIELTTDGGQTAPRFIMEKRAGSGPQEDRYWCSAPLRTEDHIKALQDIEKLIK